MKPPASTKPLRIVFFPSLQKMMANPYWVMQASGLSEAGVEILDEPESHKIVWLFKNRDKIDILHFHYIQSLYCNSGHTRARLVYVAKFALYLLLARLLGYRTILTLHNLKPTHPLKPGWIDYLGHWVAVNFTERVIVHCREARRLMKARYGRGKSVFMVSHPNFIGYYPNSISKQDAREKLNLPKDACVFLFLGGVRPNKGIETLLSAFTGLKVERLRLVIAGNPEKNTSYIEELRMQAEEDTRISFHFGFIPDEALQVFYNACDIVVLPFSSILTSGSTILAMSFGRPVIAPRMGCLPELLEPDAGWLFEAGDNGNLSGLISIAAREDFAQMGCNAYHRILSKTHKQFISQTMLCYRINHE